MAIRIIIGVSVLSISMILYLLGNCILDSWLLLVSAVIVLAALLLQYQLIREKIK